MDVIIWGAKGHAKVLAELIGHTGRRVIALFDNDPRAQSPLVGVPLFIGWEGFSAWIEGRDVSRIAFAVAIGGDKGADRIEIAAQLRELGLHAAECVHKSAYVSPTAIVGRGCQVLANATVGVDAKLGEQCIVNTGAVVDHECELGAGAHIGPGATLAGCVTVGECSFIGTNATVLPRVLVGRHATVGAGAVVTKDVPDDSIVYGVPARVRSTKTWAPNLMAANCSP